jgi:dephospho-CoA kinase
LTRKVKLLFVDAGDDVSLYENRIRSRGRIVSEEKIVQRVAKIPTELTEGRRIADGIIKNQGTLEEYHMEIKKCLLENGLIDDNNEKSRGIRSFKIQ